MSDSAQTNSGEKPGREKKHFNNKKRRFHKNRTERNTTQTPQTIDSKQEGQDSSSSREVKRQYFGGGYKFREKAPDWSFDESLKGNPFTETKADLMQILADVNPDELMMTPLVQKKKITKESDLDDNSEEILVDDLGSSSKVSFEVVKSCPICGKPIREIMYALHDFDHDKLAHFDCVYKKLMETLKEKLTDKRYLAYLGSGSFGIMETVPNKPNKSILIEKIYPGAPVEELLHAGEHQLDEEL